MMGIKNVGMQSLLLLTLSILKGFPAQAAAASGRENSYLINHYELINMSTSQRTEYLQFLAKILATMEYSSNFEAASNQRREFNFFSILMTELFSEAWAHGDHAHESPTKSESTPKAKLLKGKLKEEPSAEEYFRSLNDEAIKNETVEKSKPMTNTLTRNSGSSSVCASGKCCIHSGNLIPTTAGRCLGAAYIACQTSDAAEGFKCNPIVFGLNAKKAPICIRKGPPHNYTDQCSKLSDAQATLEYVKANVVEWTKFRAALNAYCESNDVPNHNKPNCDLLKKRVGTLGADALLDRESSTPATSTR